MHLASNRLDVKGVWVYELTGCLRSSSGGWGGGVARERDPFGLALSRLRGDVRDGRPLAGEPLITMELAAALQISVTPIREAIARLAGEGLLDDRRGRGVYTFRYAAEDVEALYRLHEAYVRLALETAQSPLRRAAEDPAPLSASSAPAVFRARTERFWGGIVEQAEGGPIVRAHQRVVDQLAVVRLTEPQVLNDAEGELEGLIETARTSPPAALDEAVDAYHRRRVAKSRALATAAFGAVAPNPV